MHIDTWKNWKKVKMKLANLLDVLLPSQVIVLYVIDKEERRFLDEDTWTVKEAMQEVGGFEVLSVYTCYDPAKSRSYLYVECVDVIGWFETEYI